MSRNSIDWVTCFIVICQLLAATVNLSTLDIYCLILIALLLKLTECDLVLKLQTLVVWYLSRVFCVYAFKPVPVLLKVMLPMQYCLGNYNCDKLDFLSCQHSFLCKCCVHFIMKVFAQQICIACVCTQCPEKREQHRFVHLCNFYKFKCIVLIFGKQHCECIAKLLL